MLTEDALTIQRGEIAQIVESIWAAMLGLAVLPCELPWSPGPDRLSAAVHLTGEWNGAVLIEGDGPLACRLAGRFLSQPASPAVDDVVRDVLGELANMIGGNLKCALCQGIHLSMPTVIDGSNYGLRICGSQIRETLAFVCPDGQFWVTTLETPKSIAPPTSAPPDSPAQNSRP